MQNPGQALVQSSEVFLGKSEGPPAMNFSNQVHVNNVLRPHAGPVGTMRSKYLSKPYSFAGNSGNFYSILDVASCTKTLPFASRLKLMNKRVR